MEASHSAAPSLLSMKALTLAVSGIWSETLGLPRVVDLDTNFFDAGGDSLRLLRLRNALNERFGLNLGGIELFEHTTIRRLVAFIDALQRPRS